MEPLYGSDVASNGADGQVLVTTGTSLLDDPADEPAANALIPSCLGDDDRLDFRTRTLVEQTSQTDDPAVGLGHPGPDPLRRGEVAIESRSRVVSTDRRVPIDGSVVLRQLCPQGSTSAVVALGVVANDELRRGWESDCCETVIAQCCQALGKTGISVYEAHANRIAPGPALEARLGFFGLGVRPMAEWGAHDLGGEQLHHHRPVAGDGVADRLRRVDDR